jgi:murein L,D-transpeptidase YcbB/YkuD
MELNPQWTIPWSIRKKEINGQGGNADYFNRNKYFARNKKTGEKLRGADITNRIIMSPDWSIVQEGGEGNSLGRIIFRFDNNFSIFVHDTSSRGVFNRQTRSVSHGCIRVEKPYELACYMLRDKDPEMAEKIQYSMEVDMSDPKRDRRKIVGFKKVDPQVPIFIVYYTLFAVPEGDIKSFPDVYEYDSIIAKALRSI